MMGILGWIFLPVVGIILGGDGLATVGLVLCYANLVMGLCGCLIVLLFPALIAGLWSDVK